MISRSVSAVTALGAISLSCLVVGCNPSSSARTSAAAQSRMEGGPSADSTPAAATTRERASSGQTAAATSSTLTTAVATEKASMPELETVTLGAGCFWCIEAVLLRIKGIEAVQSGYMGGTTRNPSYQMVCTGRTGHAEVVQIKFDPSVLPFDKLLDIFFQLHDPTTLNRQGFDVGTQYRSAIFYHTDAQKKTAEASLKKWNESGKFSDPIVTEIVPASDFYPAEDYHQDYFNKNPGNPYCRANILPKFKKLGLLKDSD